MITYLLGRLARSATLLLVVTLLTFTLVSYTPGDAAYTLLGARATEEQLQALRHSMGLDQPVLVQYWNWLTSLLHGDLGHSLLSGQPTSQALSQRLLPTLSLLGGTILLSSLLGVLLGVTAALRGGALARAVDLAGLSGLAVPNFVLGLLLIPLFAVWLGVLPASGYTGPSDSPTGWLASLVLPVCALALTVIGILARQLKVTLTDVLDREFILTMRGNGYSRASILYRHALRNAGLPVVANLGVVVVGLLSGSVLIETVFAFPGLGTLLVQASGQADIPVVEGVVVVMTVVVIAVNLAVDSFSAWLDPRVARS